MVAHGTFRQICGPCSRTNSNTTALYNNANGHTPTRRFTTVLDHTHCGDEHHYCPESGVGWASVYPPPQSPTHCSTSPCPPAHLQPFNDGAVVARDLQLRLAAALARAQPLLGRLHDELRLGEERVHLAVEVHRDRDPAVLR